MWEKISTDIEGRSAKQCKDEKIHKTVLKRKKAAVENNHTSGTRRPKVEFAQALENITAMNALLHI